MRCLACNCELTDFQATRKSARTGEYLDLCDDCIEPIKEELELIEREDLRTSQLILEEEFYEED